MKLPMRLNAAETFSTLRLASVPDQVIRDAMVATHETGLPAPVGTLTLWAGDGHSYSDEWWRITS